MGECQLLWRKKRLPAGRRRNTSQVECVGKANLPKLRWATNYRHQQWLEQRFRSGHRLISYSESDNTAYVGYRELRIRQQVLRPTGRPVYWRAAHIELRMGKSGRRASVHVRITTG